MLPITHHFFFFKSHFRCGARFTKEAETWQRKPLYALVTPKHTEEIRLNRKIKDFLLSLYKIMGKVLMKTARKTHGRVTMMDISALTTLSP